MMAVIFIITSDIQALNIKAVPAVNNTKYCISHVLICTYSFTIILIYALLVFNFGASFVIVGVQLILKD